MSQDVGELLNAATSNLVLDGGAAQRAIKRHRQRARRRWAAGAITAVAALTSAIAIPFGVNSAGGSADVNRLVPAATPNRAISSPTVAASVAGIDLLYLPKGFAPYGGLGAASAIGHPDQVTIYQNYRPRAAPEYGTPPTLSVGVLRGAAANLDNLAKARANPTWTTVRGHRALLQTTKASPGDPQPRYRLTWTPAPNVTVTVDATGGVSQTEARHVAQGILIGPSSSPADPAADEAQIRRVVSTVFTGGHVNETLANITQGFSLAKTVNELGAVQPELMRTVRPSSITVTFVGRDVAIALANLRFSQGLDEQMFPAQVTLERSGDRWRVTRPSYCSVIATLVACPTE